MTAVAVICCIDMCCIFTNGRGAVVTTGTRAEDGGVVDGGDRFPGLGRMAIVTGVGGIDMSRVFSCGIGTVVAIRASTSHRTVIDRYSFPVGCYVAVLTGI